MDKLTKIVKLYMVYWLTRSWSVHFSHDVGHARLVGNEGSEMNGFGWIILGESLYLAPVSLTPLLGQKAKGAVTRCRELTMWLKWTCFSITRIWLYSSIFRNYCITNMLPVPVTRDRFHVVNSKSMSVDFLFRNLICSLIVNIIVRYYYITNREQISYSLPLWSTPRGVFTKGMNSKSRIRNFSFQKNLE